MGLSQLHTGQSSDPNIPNAQIIDGILEAEQAFRDSSPRCFGNKNSTILILVEEWK